VVESQHTHPEPDTVKRIHDRASTRRARRGGFTRSTRAGGPEPIDHLYIHYTARRTDPYSMQVGRRSARVSP